MMVEQDLEARVAHLEHQLEGLQKRLSLLETGLDGVSVDVQDEDSGKAAVLSGGGGLSSWAGKAALLPRVATVCFIMVLALALRTATDNHLINQQVGTILGMSYAAILVLVGWFLYHREGDNAPVFTGAGAFLLCSMVVETQAHFKTLTPVPAYFILMMLGATLGAQSQRFQKPGPVIIGTLGMCLAGAAIDYPTPLFSYLAPLLLLANVLAFNASRLKNTSWLRWFVFGMTVLIAQVWAMRLGMYLFADQIPPEPLAENWFFPLVAIYGIGFIFSSFFGVWRTGDGPIALFDNVAPTLTVVWVVWSSHYVLQRGGSSFFGLGVAGILAALLCYFLIHMLAQRKIDHTPGGTTLSMAGSLLLVLCLPLATHNLVVAAAVYSGVAVWLAWMSEKWRNSGVRWVSYLLQIAAGFGLVVALRNHPDGQNLLITLAGTGLTAIGGIYHYVWSRRYPPLQIGRVFGHFDTCDRSAALVLLSGLSAGFFQARSLLYWGLHQMSGNQFGAFVCLQSVLINSAIAVLMVLAWKRNSRELKNVAILVTLVAAFKVFMIDLFSTKGIPLLLSVLSFGIVASVESVVLARWQKLDAFAGEREKTAEKGEEVKV
ncbi:hypothetical protein C2E25_11690 [Geothermobacter hydrogeniphilus]|uniref:DUF2339 domain-containing protein n=1 Tax=Geothermobacter hydrogeniphilus TaxID=1969733 RepID=A0A2K2H8F6_9BACT|nr:DUF2339 domain-containing protein [Geothermobacter hydrogeniphilus]PNU19594.1 hypothetical protein C2E25_11690 [Geothermobacter hydrogeniphilus]